VSAESERHLARLHDIHTAWRGHVVPLATPPGARYPYVYPRDLAAIARAFDRVGDTGTTGARMLEGAAAFLVAAQGLEGAWGQRYDLEARDQSIYRQEDNTAHAIAVLARHVRHHRRDGREAPDEAACMSAIERGLAYARSSVYRKGINLYYSTTSIHESAIEQGYTLWTNGAYRDAYRLAVETTKLTGDDERSRKWDEQRARLEENIQRHFVQDGQWIRGLTADGRFDRRPDVTLLSPHYFQFEHLDEDAAERSAERAERELWDPDLGLLQRYLPFREDPHVHLHAGNGPWLAYTAWLAQRHAAHGRKKRAQEILDLIERFATPDGSLPEHVSTRERFQDFMVNEWETGLDFRKEFDPGILLPHVTFSTILEEAVRMRTAYDDAGRVAEQSGDGIIRFATPLGWSHAEAAVAYALL
jgi:GH15 family glucan-1,4-alpha-glucosidase